MTEEEFVEDEENQHEEVFFLEWIVTGFLAIVFIFFIIKFLFL